MKRYRYNRGFSLVELTMYGLLLSIFLTIISQMFLSVLDVSMESQAYVAHELDSRYILSRLTHDMSRASAIISPSTIGDVVHNVILAIDGSNYTYASDSGTMTLTTPSGSYNLNSIDSYITGFDVTRIGTASDSASIYVKLTVTAKSVLHQGPQVRIYETTIGLRP